MVGPARNVRPAPLAAHPRFPGFWRAAVGEGEPPAPAYCRSVARPDSSALARRVARAAGGDHPDERSLRVALLDAVRAEVAADAYAWLLTDPETEVGGAPLADVPCLPELPRLIRLKYLTPVNRWTLLAGGVARLHAATAGHLERSLAWRSLLARYDVVDVASVVFRDRFGCWGFLDLWRVGAHPPFTDAEARLLAGAVPPITEVLRHRQARHFGTVVPAPPPAPPPAGPVVLILGPDLDVRAQTPEVEGHLRALLPSGPDRAPVPAAAYNVGAQLLAVEAGVDDHPPMARMYAGGGTWLTLRAARIGARGPAGEGEVAVAIERSTPAERRGVFVRACGLSGREAELVAHLAAGADTRRVAAQMFLSEHTVQDHLKSIFAKTGTRNRRALLARVVGP
jgi:DNA-binding CsgD family transcriptional regulator